MKSVCRVLLIIFCCSIKTASQNNEKLARAYIHSTLNGVITTESETPSLTLNNWHKDSTLINDLWNQVTLKNGCLVGAQYTYDLSPEQNSELFRHSFLGDSTFEVLLNNRRCDLTKFLVEQLDDTSQTHIHVCPFFSATKGEFAIYTLQQIHKQSWYDFQEFSSFKDRETTMSNDCPQSWLRDILGKDTTRVLMQSAWKSLCN